MSDTESSFDDQTPPAKKRQEPEEKPTDLAEESDTCPICYERWSSSGPHRIVSLRCGHLFGRDCIERWLAGITTGKSTSAPRGCPQCNAPAKAADVRVLFVRRIVAVDGDERQQLLSQLEAEKNAAIKAQQQLTKSNLAHQLALAEIDRLNRCIGSGVQSKSSPSSPPESPSLALSRVSVVCSDRESATCFDWDSFKMRLVVGKRSEFPKTTHGILKVAPVTGALEFYATGQSSTIKQLRCSPFGDDLVLSASLDRTLRLSSSNSNSSILGYGPFPHGVWSCSFNHNNRNVVYAGLADGSIVVCDLRQTATAVATLDAMNDLRFSTKTPIHSISWCSEDRLVAGSFGEFSVFSLDANQQVTESMPMGHGVARGTCSCVSSLADRDFLLVGIRAATQQYQGYRVRDNSVALVASFDTGVAMSSLSRCSMYRYDTEMRMLSISDRNCVSIQSVTECSVDGVDSFICGTLETLPIPGPAGQDIPILDARYLDGDIKQSVAVLGDRRLFIYS